MIIKSPLKSHHNRSKLNVLGAKDSHQDAENPHQPMRVSNSEELSH